VFINTEIRLATENDLSSYYEFLVDHSKESKKEKMIFRYSEEAWEFPRNEFIEDKKNRWSKTISETQWEQVWILTDNIKVYGHLVLQHSPVLKTNLHRANLSMGVIDAYRGKKYGFKFLGMAIQWAKEQKDLDWIQLSVFSHNIPAINLYKKVGFIEVGMIQDNARVFGQRINETTMILKIN
jgi:RimJ/RimL family protein N-acetyltransferase